MESDFLTVMPLEIAKRIQWARIYAPASADHLGH
jgi:hypothetical protein